MTRHFGALVPSTNTTVEIEYNRLLPETLQLHAARLGKPPGIPFSPSLNEDVAYQSKMLGNAKVETLCLTQTSASLFEDGYDDRIKNGDRRLTHVDDISSVLGEDVISMNVMGSRDDLKHLARILEEELPDKLENFFFENPYSPPWWWLTIHDIKACKSIAITELLEYTGFKREHLTVFGDNLNDVKMFQMAERAIAVANATDAARAAADIILTAPGLGVINEAVKQARITFERMKSYALFRIAETIRIILFMSLSILIFGFYPITALMIILLALLNDIPILAIAYDHTRVDPKPVRWNLPETLTVSSVLGVAGVVASFLLFFLLREYGFSDDMIQTAIFLKLIVAGHSTLYVTRAQGWFWQKPYPSPLLLGATFGTEILGTLIAVYGFLVTPIGWTYALAMWGYALAWFVFNDAVKNWTYHVLSRNRSREAGGAQAPLLAGSQG